MATKDEALAKINAALHKHGRKVRAGSSGAVLRRYQDTSADSVDAFVLALSAVACRHLLEPVGKELDEIETAEIPSTVEKSAVGLTEIAWVQSGTDFARCEATVLGHKVNITAQLQAVDPGVDVEFRVEVFTGVGPILTKTITGPVAETATMAIRECISQLVLDRGSLVVANEKAEAEWSPADVAEYKHDGLEHLIPKSESGDVAKCGTNLDGELVSLACSRPHPDAMQFSIDATKAGQSKVWKGFSIPAKSKDETAQQALERFLQGIREKAGTDIPHPDVPPKHLRDAQALDEDKCTRNMFVDGRGVIVHACLNTAPGSGPNDYLVGLVGDATAADPVQADNAEQAIGNWIDDKVAAGVLGQEPKPDGLVEPSAERQVSIQGQMVTVKARRHGVGSYLFDVVISTGQGEGSLQCLFEAPNVTDTPNEVITAYAASANAKPRPDDKATDDHYPPRNGTFGCVLDHDFDQSSKTPRAHRFGIYEGGPAKPVSTFEQDLAASQRSIDTGEHDELVFGNLDEKTRAEIVEKRRQRIAEGAKRLDQEVAGMTSTSSGYHKPVDSFIQGVYDRSSEHYDKLEAEQAEVIRARRLKTHPCALCPSIAVFYRKELRQPYALPKGTRLRVNVVAYAALAYALGTYALWAFNSVHMNISDDVTVDADNTHTQNSSLPSRKGSLPSSLPPSTGSLPPRKGLNVGLSTPDAPNPHPFPIVLLAVTLLGLTSLRSGPFLCNTCRNEDD